MTALTGMHKQRLEEIRKKLTLIGCKESSFVAVELLFYEAITISRTYGNDIADNQLLATLKQIEADQYKTTKQFFRKSSQREQAIKKFMVRLKNVLSIEITQ